MKHLLFSIIFIIAGIQAHGQCIGDNLHFYDFDNSSENYDCLFYRDDTQNVWHIGAPHKSTFWISRSLSRALITDTANTYPPNDTSYFTLSNRAGVGLEFWRLCGFNGYYYAHTDTLTDYGLIEFSPDNGHTWIDLLHDTDGIVSWLTLKPTFSGNSGGWKYFRCYINFSGTPYTFHSWYDTVIYRFSFISDTEDTHKDGLMFDDLFFEDFTEDVPSINNTNHIIALYPNPATDNIRIQYPAGTAHRSLRILSYTGSVVQEVNNYAGQDINVAHLPSGMYILKYADERSSDAVPFHIQR